MTRALNELKPGHEGWVVKVSGDDGTSRRMLTLGLTPGTLIRVERVAPMGDPIVIRVRGYSLLVRKSEANQIVVRMDPV